MMMRHSLPVLLGAVLLALAAHAQPLSNAPNTDSGLSRGGDARTDISLRRAGAAAGTVTPTPLLFNTNTVTPTVTATRTITATPTVTATPTSADEQGQMFGVFKPDVTGGTTHDFSFDEYGGGSSPEGAFEMGIPIALRVRVMYVVCTTAPGSGKTLTVQLDKNTAAISGASCTISGTGTPPTCTVTLANDSTADFAVGDRMVIDSVFSSSGSTASNCRVSLYYRQSGDAGEQDSIINGDNTGAHTVNGTYYCSEWGNTSNVASPGWHCDSADTNKAPWIMPHAGTFTGLTARSGGNRTTQSESWTWQSSDGAANTDLTVTLAGLGTSTVNGAADTTCTSNCALAQGDRPRLQFVESGSAGDDASKSRQWMTSLDGMGAVFEAMEDGFSITTGADAYMGPAFVGLANVSNTSTWRTAASSTARNLFCLAYGTPTNAITAALATSATDPTALSASALTCTLAVAANPTCSDTTHGVTLAVGDYISIKLTSVLAGAIPVHCVIELPPQATATPTATQTPTVTQTPTITNTPGPTNTPASLNPTPGAADYGTLDDSHFSQQNVLIADNLVTNFGLSVAVVKWDTSAIPDGATIDSATVDFTTRSTNCLVNTDSFPAVAGWYTAPGSWTAGDYTAVTDNSAYDSSPDSIGITFGTCTHTYTLTLSSPNTAGHINKTGYSAIRFWVKRSGVPTGQNIVNFNGSNTVPTLHVIYH